jgi:hypothetical protein
MPEKNTTREEIIKLVDPELAYQVREMLKNHDCTFFNRRACSEALEYIIKRKNAITAPATIRYIHLFGGYDMAKQCSSI